MIVFMRMEEEGKAYCNVLYIIRIEWFKFFNAIYSMQ